MNTSIPRIVVIEDNPADVRLFRIALDEIGDDYELVVLSDGADALRFIKERAAAYSPCVIILDLHLPCYDGVAILSAIRAMPELSHVDVVVLTTLGSPDEQAAVRSLGVALYQQKPQKLEELRAFAEEILRLCRDEPVETAA